MPKNKKPKTVLEYFQSGNEIDAAVRRAVREAVGAPKRKPSTRAKARKSPARKPC